MLYRELERHAANPVIHLNHAVALSFTTPPAEALQYLNDLQLDEQLSDYHTFHTVMADLIIRTGAGNKAIEHLDRAIALCDNQVELKHLERKRYSLLN